MKAKRKPKAGTADKLRAKGMPFVPTKLRGAKAKLVKRPAVSRKAQRKPSPAKSPKPPGDYVSNLGFIIRKPFTG
jgi:hypothetical protein